MHLPGFFNEQATSLLRRENIPLPPSSAVGTARFCKMTGPARQFLSIVCQRQLNGLLSGQSILSEHEIAAHLRAVGVRSQDSPVVAFLQKGSRSSEGETSPWPCYKEDGQWRSADREYLLSLHFACRSFYS